MRKTLLVPIILTVVLAGCSWGIKLSDAGRRVQTDWNGPMTGCKQLGKVTVSVADRLGPFDRNSIKVRDELEVMARNEDAGMGADTVHPLAEPNEGSQLWGAYQCKGAAAPASTSTRNNGTQTFPVDSGA
jgi:hypothetical protein